MSSKQSNHEWNRGQLGIRPGFARFFLCFSAFGVGCFCWYFAVLCIGTYCVFPCMASFSHLASVSSCFLAVRANCIFLARTSKSGVISLLFCGQLSTKRIFLWYGLICITNIGSHNWENTLHFIYLGSLTQVLGCKLWEVSGPVYDFRQIKWQLVLWMIKRSSCPALDSVLVCMYQKSTACLFSSFWTRKCLGKCLQKMSRNANNHAMKMYCSSRHVFFYSPLVHANSTE